MVEITHLLDTNVFVQILRGKGANIVDRIENHPPGSLALSSVTMGELAYGAYLSKREKEFSRIQRLLSDFKIISFDEQAAWEYGKIRHELSSSGNPIGGLDMLIAAIARSRCLTVVTHNWKDFNRISNLNIVDWQSTDSQ